MSEPIYHSEKLTYGSYLRIPQLLSLQQELSDPPHHDELLFILSHQVYELWFKQMLHEFYQINQWLDEDQPLRAAQLWERVHKIQHLLIEQLPVLETMFAVDFAKFRDNLRPASGFQSVQFRKVEFLSGAKNPGMLKLVGEDEEAKAEMATYLDRPTVYDHYLHHLSRTGFSIPEEVLSRDTSQPHTLNEQTLDAIEELYRKSEQHFQQFRLAEHLMEFEEKFAIWRFHHVQMVLRMIGDQGGTGGSSGARYLQRTLAIRLFPEIWAVRTRLAGIEY